MKMLPVLHKLTKATQFFQDHNHSPNLWWSGCNWWLGVTGRSSGVTWQHNPFFANNSRQYGDRDAQILPNDVSCQAASEVMHIDLLGSGSDLDMTWGQILKSTFQGQNVDIPNRIDEVYTVHDGVIYIFKSLISKKLQMKTHLHEKRLFFIWWPLESKLFSSGQIRLQNVTPAWRELSHALLNFS